MLHKGIRSRKYWSSQRRQGYKTNVMERAEQDYLLQEYFDAKNKKQKKNRKGSRGY